MKVINSWDSPEEPTMNSRCADCNYEDCRCGRPLMPAAGTWRYDVENAPKDGRWIVGYFDFIDGTNLYCGKWVIDEWRDAYNYRLSDSQLRAFATINRPEIEK